MIMDIKNYLALSKGRTLLDKTPNFDFSNKEIEFMSFINKHIVEKDRQIINNLNPSNDYSVVAVGSLHVPSAVNKLQKIGYKTDIFLPENIGNAFVGLANSEKIINELLSGFEKTQYSKKESLVIADRPTMIYSLEGILKKPEELLEKGINKISICYTKSTYSLYNELRNELKKYVLKCKSKNIGFEFIELDSRKEITREKIEEVSIKKVFAKSCSVQKFLSHLCLRMS